MTLKTLLACLPSEEQAASVIGMAADLARSHSAHLIGFHARQQLFVYPGAAMSVPDAFLAEFAASEAALAEAIRKIFDVALAAEDFAHEWREDTARAGDLGGSLIDSARAADLVVMPKATRDRAQLRHIQEEVVRECGRPVLLVPEATTSGALGRNILIGWSPTREAARAVHDALMLAQPGARVTLLSVGRSDEDQTALSHDMAQALDRHGLVVEVAERVPDGLSIADCLLKEAFERGADLVVTGAFGHSRLFDFAIGAVTVTLMRNADRPVLFSA